MWKRDYVLGQASGALEKALKYVQEREQFGKPIVEFQAVQMKLAEMAMKVEGSRLLIHRAAHNAQEGFPSIFESSVGKCFSNETAREVVASAMQLMGVMVSIKSIQWKDITEMFGVGELLEEQ